MKKLKIPEDDAALLKQWLASEDREPIESVLEALEAVTPALSLGVLAKRIAERAGVPGEDLQPFLRVFLNAANTIAHFDDEDRKDAASIVFHSVVGDVADAAQRERFLQRFTRISQAKSIEITGKALGVLQEDQKGFCTARIVSQLRPIFSDEPLEPRATVIIHQLKLIYHVGPEGDRDEIFIATTKEDLLVLREVIDRAIVKHEKLVSTAEKAGIPLL